MAILYAHDSPCGWGKHFALAAGRAGDTCVLFRNAHGVPDGAGCFVRLDQIAGRRDASKAMVLLLHAKGCATLPTAQEAVWYDDKALQTKGPLQEFAPATFITRNYEAARQYLLNHDDYPIVSKASIGAGGANVRLLRGYDEACAEMEAIFNGAGLPLTYGNVQKGYVYWQKFLPGNDVEYRWIVTGDVWFGIERRSAGIYGRANSSLSPIRRLSDRSRAALDLCFKIASRDDMKWMAFDVVFDGDDAKCLEISSAWPVANYASCPAAPYLFWADDFMATHTGGHMFDFAVRVLKERS